LYNNWRQVKGDSLMTHLRIALLVLVAALAACAVPATAQRGNEQCQRMEILRQKLNADKKLLIAANMNLTEVESPAFWPIFDAYQKDLQQINERLAKLIAVYAEAYNQGKGSIPAATAKTLLEEALAIDEAEVALKRSHIPELNVALPPAKVARYIQMENKIRALVRFDLATNVPLVQ
jgi:hypothetical protein